MPQSVQITETSPLLHDANCVYCHVDLVLNDRAVVCERCKSPHHHDCWGANNDRCATFGCKDAGLIRLQNVTGTEDSHLYLIPIGIISGIISFVALFLWVFDWLELLFEFGVAFSIMGLFTVGLIFIIYLLINVRE